MKYDEQEALEFAHRIKAMGYKVFLAEKKTYGYITDETGARVLSFSASMYEGLSGNYRSDNNSDGSGWKMYVNLHDLKTKKDVQQALNAHPPHWCHIRGKVRYTTEKMYRDWYQDSSKFVEI